ncbi:replication initiation protein [Ralstonia phage Raharianne]|uniref:Uncharacterized protein n=2 Tax=Rahariannevirus raharianne TaxID=2846050 RepID=A0A7G5BBB5_9CAUD|nr:replication initiation protein [Ralstonia phage Raharianne]QMV32394.1 hypothetical protein U2_00019 [Ralstonia phage Albius]QMV33588.1 hypothetical protein Y2_00019 [Ralstonia phage Raharianne]
MLASLLYPYDDDAPGLIDRWLDELEGEACLHRYKIDGNNYVQIANWLIHQKIDKPSKSKIPAFCGSSRDFANPRELSSEDQGSKDQGSKDQGKETPPNPPSPGGDEGAETEIEKTSGLLLDNDAADRLEGLQGHNFYRYDPRVVFDQKIELRASNASADTVTVYERLAAK